MSAAEKGMREKRFVDQMEEMSEEDADSGKGDAKWTPEMRGITSGASTLLFGGEIVSWRSFSVRLLVLR